MNNTQIILVIGFISIGAVLYLGLDNLAKNQPKSDFQACIDSLDGQSFNTNNERMAKTLICAGTK